MTEFSVNDYLYIQEEEDGDEESEDFEEDNKDDNEDTLDDARYVSSPTNQSVTMVTVEQREESE